MTNPCKNKSQTNSGICSYRSISIPVRRTGPCLRLSHSSFLALSTGRTDRQRNEAAPSADQLERD